MGSFTVFMAMFQNLPMQHLSQSELQARAEQFLEPSKTLQELPLILVSPYFLDSSQDWRTAPKIHTAIENWLERAKLDDERLCIERRLIPHTPIYIPDTPEGQEFFKLAKAIADIPLRAPIVPKNQNQGYWLKTLHYYWQARGVVVAQRLLGVIPDPLEEGGVLFNRLSNKNLEYLQMSREIDDALFHLLKAGENYIKQWAEKNQIRYPFEGLLHLFLSELWEEFLLTWQLGPGNSEKEAISKANQRANFAIRVRLLRQSSWSTPESEGESISRQEDRKKIKQRPPYKLIEQEYLEYLKEIGWSGWWVLALRPRSEHGDIEPYWISYVQALSQGRELTIDILDWLKGRPSNRPHSNPHQAVEGTLNLLGYILWTWV